MIPALMSALPALGLGEIGATFLDASAVLLPLREVDADVPVITTVLPPALDHEALDGLVVVVRLGEPANVTLGYAQVEQAQA
jgi:hypothetical protein